jgi:hypothetical protein
MLVDITKRVLRRSPTLTRFAGAVYKMLSGPFKGSETYWSERYRKGGNSGPGSYSALAEFKASVLNGFVAEQGVASVIEFGCGDGNQLTLGKYPRYLGLDVSDVAVERCRQRFASDSTKSFKLLGDYSGEKADLALSLDVIYHLVEDQVFERHLLAVFGAATRFVAVYSTNVDAPDDAGLAHVRHRHFTDFVERRLPEWKLLRVEHKARPYTGDIATSSLADFYFYERK